MSSEVSDYVIQSYLEQCIKRHMNLNEVKNTLLLKAKIKPEYTELAWKALEKANPRFFKAYHFRLLVKDQIVRFNILLARQVELVTGISIEPNPIHPSNGFDIPLNNINSTFNGQDKTGCAWQAGDMFQPLGCSLDLNGRSSSVQPCMQGTVDISNNDRIINTSSNMLMDESLNMGFDQGMTFDLDNLFNPQYQIEQQDNSMLNERFEGFNFDNFWL